MALRRGSPGAVGPDAADADRSRSGPSATRIHKVIDEVEEADLTRLRDFLVPMTPAADAV